MLSDEERDQLYRECNTTTEIGGKDRVFRMYHRPTGIVVTRLNKSNDIGTVWEMLDELHQRLQEKNDAER